jgi:putative endonuclease
MNTRAKGAFYEQKAREYLKTQGYRILASNYRCRAGEIDLIARQGDYLVFIEVKYRHDGAKGSGLEAVDIRKQRRILRAARWYLMEKHIDPEQPCRFDVLSFCGEEITLIRDAFQYEV